jgi:hypothetical protein
MKCYAHQAFNTLCVASTTAAQDPAANTGEQKSLTNGQAVPSDGVADGDNHRVDVTKPDKLLVERDALTNRWSYISEASSCNGDLASPDSISSALPGDEGDKQDGDGKTTDAAGVNGISAGNYTITAMT